MASRRGRIAAFPRNLPSNPYCELLYDHVERLGVEVVEGQSGMRWLLRARPRVGALHFHWPEHHYRRGSLASAVGFALRLLAARLMGYRIVWTVHNVMPHEDGGLGDRLVTIVLSRLATAVVHCEVARKALGRIGRSAFVIPHGSYVGRYPNGIGARAARDRLGLEPDARVFLSFGQLRSYKGLDALLHSFAALRAPRARLVVAGEPVGKLALPHLDDPRIRLFPRHIPDAEVQLFLNAADLVVLPYRSVLTSGAAMLALSFGRGLVAPRLGCLAELGRSGAVLLYDPDRPGALAAALERGLEVDPAALGERARRFVRTRSWDMIARRHLAAYGLMPRVAVLLPRSASTPAARPAGKERTWT